MSDGINFNEQIQHMLGLGGSSAASSSTAASSNASSTTEASNASTLSKSQIEDDAKKAIYPASMPFLIAPDYMQLIAQTKLSFEDLKQKIIGDLLDKWSESIKVMAQEERHKFEKLLTTGLDKLFNARIIPGANGPMTIQDVYNLEAARVEGAAASPIGLGLSVLMINALSIIAGPATLSIGVAQPGMGLMQALASSPIVPQTLDPSLKPNVLTQLSALILLPSFYPAMAKAVGLMQLNPKANLEEEFATQFLKQNILLAKSADFSEFLKAIAQLMPQVAQMGSKQQETLVFTAKMMLLLSSLALFYKTETGGLTGAELKGMVSGEMQLPPGDPRLEAVAVIRQLLQSVKLPDKEVNTMMEAFYQYFGGDPDYEDLLNPLDTMKVLTQDLSVPKNTMQAI